MNPTGSQEYRSMQKSIRLVKICIVLALINLVFALIKLYGSL